MTSPTIATTSAGVELPVVALAQHELLTIDSEQSEWIADPGGNTLWVKPLRLDVEGGVWVALFRYSPGTVVGLHYHTGEAEVLTLQGRWNYVEYPDQPQTVGSYLFEPAGSVHTLVVPADGTEDTIMFVRVRGANVNFTEDGAFESIIDATSLTFGADLLAEADPGSIRFIRGGQAT